MQIERVFWKQHAVLPVVHVVSEAQALHNAHVARDAGADGVFLINHREGDVRPIDYRRLLQIHKTVHDSTKGWWVGVNCLDLTPTEVMEVVTMNVQGIWVDNAMINELATDQKYGRAVQEIRKKRRWCGLYFGGVAFKYQPSVADEATAARKAIPYVDVVTTSGIGTGQAASISKIRRMKQAIGDAPLAIASGITPENVERFLPWVDVLLVATGISDASGDLASARVQMLVDAVRNFKPD